MTPEGAAATLDLLLLGPVGAGKGTQARRIAERYALPHVASGDLLRKHRQQATPLGQQASRYMQRGELVPDDLVIDMILDRMHQPDAQHGVLLDGFPRTLPQAQALDTHLANEHRALKLALYLDVPFDELVRRATDRWTCRTCQTTYSYRVNPPSVRGVCDLDGGELYQREDDRPEVVSQRIRVYLRDTVPVVDYYRQRGLLRELDDTQSIDAVAQAIDRELSAIIDRL